MSKRWPHVALLSVLCLALSTASAGAEQPLASGLGDVLCGQDQLCGQYECVASLPLNEREVRLSMAHLAELTPRDDTTPAPADGAPQREASRR